MKYTFTLKYQLAGHDPKHEDSSAKGSSAASGNDGLVGVFHLEGMALEFSSDSADSTAAIMNALADIKRRVPTAKLVEVSTQFPG